MSHISKIFEEAPIKVQNRNGFDLSHTHSGTSKCGQLVPVLTKLLAPNSTISLGVNAEVSLPPLVAPFYGKIDFAIEGFITPLSILYGGWKHFITNNDPSNFPVTQQDLLTDKSDPTIITSNRSGFGKAGYALPVFPLVQVGSNDRAGFNTLSGTNDNIYDYMGLNFRSFITWSDTDDIDISLMPALCYHKICDVFYRNTKLTNTWFAVNPNVGVSSDIVFSSDNLKAGLAYNVKNVSLIWHSFYTNSIPSSSAGDSSVGWAAYPRFVTSSQLTFPDGVSVFSTRQRNYSRDYFTSAVASPQQGGASILQFRVDVSSAGNESGEFTINSLRMANSLQKFLETNNLSGEYADMMRNRWGVRPIDADFDEPHYLGRVVIPVYQHTISQSVQTAGQEGGNYFTDLGKLGAQASRGAANGEGSICDNFNVSCWSYLMCIASLYPHANYNYGMNRELAMTKLGDFPAPELQSVGMEDIKNYELSTSGNSVTAWMSTFGYIPRYSRFKYIDDHCSGELRPGKTLSMYQIQRDFGTSVPQLGTSFVTIAQNALDNVLSVDTSTMKLTCWWEIYFKLHVVMPLADFCIPTLGELGDTHTIKTKVGGSRL